MLEKVEKSIFLSKPIIGISGRNIDNYYKVNKSVLNAVIKCGGIPIMIVPDDLDIINMCDGIILPGGKDINDFDKEICKIAIEKDIPILGICLGMQEMASLYNENMGIIKNHNKTNMYVHKITTKKGSILNDIIGNVYVNSRHNEYVKTPGIYEITAMSNVIEGIEYKNNTFNVGVQWHPEDMLDDENELNLIKRFINVSLNKKINVLK